MGASNSPSVISFGEPPICLSTRSISPTGESSLPCAAQKNQASMRVPGRAAVRTPNVLSPRPVRAARYAATLFSLVGTLFRGPGKLLLWVADIGVGAESNHEGRSVTSVCGLIGINELPVSLGVFVARSALQFTNPIPIWGENPAGSRNSLGSALIVSDESGKISTAPGNFCISHRVSGLGNWSRETTAGCLSTKRRRSGRAWPGVSPIDGRRLRRSAPSACPRTTGAPTGSARHRRSCPKRSSSARAEKGG